MATERNAGSSELTRTASLGCPVCGAAMNHQFKLEIPISVCAEHGVWLDKGKIGELTKSVRDRMRHTGDLIRRAEVEEAAQSGASSGMFVGRLTRLFH